METGSSVHGITMHALTAKQCIGLPSLHIAKKSLRGRGGGPQLQRTWTLRTRPRNGAATTVGALPLPFMEISVSVLDTLDLVRSSVEEEIVFQATMQVPAHHAIACRIEAYDTPFAAAPALADAPQLEHMSEDDKKFAACLASPAELEEAHSINLNRPGNASFLQRSAPSVRFASGVLSVSLSLKQRSSDINKQEGQDDGEDSLTDALTDSFIESLTMSSTSRAPANSSQPTPVEGLQPASGSSNSGSRLQTASGSDGSSHEQHWLPRSGASAGSTGKHSLLRHSFLAPACASIPEHAGEAVCKDAAASSGSGSGHADAAAAAQAAPASARRSFDRQQLSSRPSGLLRVQSITARGRTTEEIPLTARLANKGVATLLGVGYMMLHALEARTNPASTLLQYQVEGFAGRPTRTSTCWPSKHV